MAQPTYHEVLQENRLLRHALAEKDRRIAELEARVARLEQLLEKSHRSNKRQAAPFSKGLPKADPKRPGRRPGDDYGQKACRTAPPVIDVGVKIIHPGTLSVLASQRQTSPQPSRHKEPTTNHKSDSDPSPPP